MKISWIKIFEVNDLSPRVMMDEKSIFSSEVWALGFSNVKPEKYPRGKSLK
jgi:hypothetical protein